MSVIGAANGIFNYQDIFKDSKIKLTKILQNLGHKKVSIEEVKISNRVYKVTDSSRAGKSLSAGRPGTWTGRTQYYGVL